MVSTPLLNSDETILPLKMHLAPNGHRALLLNEITSLNPFDHSTKLDKHMYFPPYVPLIKKAPRDQKSQIEYIHESLLMSTLR